MIFIMLKFKFKGFILDISVMQGNLVGGMQAVLARNSLKYGFKGVFV